MGNFKNPIATFFGLGLLLIGFNNCSQFNGNFNAGNRRNLSINGESLKSVPGPAARPITAREYNNLINSTFKLASNPSLEKLPVDTIEIFNFRDQGDAEASAPPWGTFEQTSEVIVELVLANRDILDQELGCSQYNVECLDRYLSRISALLFRRIPSSDENVAILELAMSHISETTDFYVGVQTVLRYCLMHPSFLLHWENGEGIEDGLVQQLSNQELLARISFFITGTGPTFSQLSGIPDEAYTDAQVSEIVNEMLETDQARATTDAFHAMWLGYQGVGADERGQMLRTETRGLIENVLFDSELPWSELLMSNKTFVNRTLASAYQIPHDGSDGFGWYEYVNPMRKGLLSHGTFLSGGRSGETNITQRGYHIRKALFCGEIQDPPPDILIDDGFTTDDPDDCKIDIIKKTALNPSMSCIGCHSQMDTIAMGIENFDNFGVYRTFETGRPECKIEEEGKLLGVGTFKGPAGLADLAIESGDVEQCLVRRVVEFGFGQRIFNDEVASYSDLLQNLENEFAVHQSYKQLVKSVALSPAFRLKIIEEK